MAGPKDQPIQHEIRGASCLVEINVAAPAVVSGQVKDDVHALRHLFGHTRLPEIGLEELHPPVTNVGLKVVELSAAQVIRDADLGPALDQSIDKMGADKRSTSRYEHAAVVPVHCAFPFSSEVRF